PDRMGGRPVKCPKCERMFDAPNGTPAAAAPPDPPLSAIPVPPPAAAATATPSAQSWAGIPVPVAAPAPTPPPNPLAQAFLPAPPGPLAPRPAGRRGLTSLVLDLPEAVVRTVPKPLQGITGLAAAALAIGLAAWGLTSLARQETVGLA